ncbi:transposase domain-containing protein [Streptomyces sp. NPDC087428]|uniref:transposase domain-containing protein n=1 Tax=Streptomyces sp. NPDC087428 TaxID=3365788 RepID=UPI003817A227
MVLGSAKTRVPLQGLQCLISVITHAPGVFAMGHLGELTQAVPFDLVDEALASAGGLQQRVRRLPSRVVVHLLLAGALFTGTGWTGIWSRLTASLPVPLPVPAGSSITAAMRRVGPKPLKALFDLAKGPAAATATQMTRFAGRLVVTIDGTQIALPDTPANLSVFPRAKTGPNGPAGYPMLRLVTLTACGTRTLMDAAFGTDATGELTYARGLITALVRLYRERWEIETSYCELKSTVLGGRVPHGRHPAAATQETWALLVAYQALRTAMSDAVPHRPDIDPDRAAFTITLNTARDQIIRATGIIHTRTDLVGQIGTAILNGLLPARRDRSRPRVKSRGPWRRTADRRTV